LFAVRSIFFKVSKMSKLLEEGKEEIMGREKMGKEGKNGKEEEKRKNGKGKNAC
jgi:hypothetical protein